MKDNVFLDTNIIIYSYSEDEFSKQKIANDLLANYYQQSIISTQVINELSNIFFKKFKLSSETVQGVIAELEASFFISNFDIQTQYKAISIKEKYQLQYYDSLIIATALEADCHILFSEDMQHQQKIENLQIINPFK